MKQLLQLSAFPILVLLFQASGIQAQTANPQQYKYVFTVAKDGSGDYRFIQDAIDAMRVFPLAPITLYIKNGVYNEKIELPANNTDVTFIGEICGGQTTFSVKVVVPVTSLCPCSKKISDYGAHNQRSHVTVTARTREFVWIEEIVQLVEAEASCELFGLLKRPDEKYVTERAYDNPKFVEDMVRDVAARLNAEPRIDAYVVESENFESIHNHSAYALIERDKRIPG